MRVLRFLRLACRSLYAALKFCMAAATVVVATIAVMVAAMWLIGLCVALLLGISATASDAIAFGALAWMALIYGVGILLALAKLVLHARRLWGEASNGEA